MKKQRVKRPARASRRAPLPKVVVVLGPTATGKSDLAVEIAQQFNGEIVSADSRQVYRGLNKGAGKITRREMKGVPHHLLDIARPQGARYTVEDFKNDGKRAVADILSRSKLPIICGGTGFYIDALVFDESFPAVAPDQKLRARLAKKSVRSLMDMLIKLDPRRARTMDPYNKVRIIRAIEIAQALGAVPKLKRRKQYEALFIGLTADNDTLRQRIRARLLKRMKTGMLTEVKNLHKNGVSWKRLHEFGLEYRHLSHYLRGIESKESALATLENEICAFSKRQLTWFKRNKDIIWFSLGQTRPILRSVKEFLR